MMLVKKNIKKRSSIFSTKKSSKKKSQKLRLKRINSKVIIFVLLFGIAGSFVLYRIFAASDVPSGSDEIVLDYRIESANTIDSGADLQPLVYSHQPVLVRILGDGTIYCGDSSTNKVNEGKLTGTELQSYYNQVLKSGLNKLSDDIAPSGNTTFTGNYTGIVIGSNSQAKRVYVYDGIAKPRNFIKAEQILLKACVKATKNILRSEARVVKSPKLVSSSNFTNSIANKISPKAEAGINVYSYETRLYDLHNSRRASLGLNGLFRASCTTNAAREWASYMARNNYFAHSDLNSLITRHCGSGWRAVGENVGKDPNQNADQIFQAYINSPCHRANIESRVANKDSNNNCNPGALNTQPWHQIGVGAAQASDGTVYNAVIFTRCSGCGGGFSTPQTPPSPSGNVDSNTCSNVGGWSYDPADSSRRMEIHIYYSNLDGSGQEVYGAYTDVFRADVNNAFGISGNHGFQQAVPAKWKGKDHKTLVYAIGSNGNNPLIGGGNVSGCGAIGNVDVRDRCDVIAGWAFDRSDPARSIDVHIYLKNLDGSNRVGYNTGPTNTYRGDVNAAYGISGNHGYSWPVPAEWANKPHIAEIYAIGTGGTNPLIGTTNISYCGAIGNVDSNKCSNKQGWAINKAATSATVELHVYFFNPDGSGREVLPAYTSVFRGDVNQAYRVDGNHGFNYSVPSRWATKAHKVEIYAISQGGNAYLGGGNCTF